jgi:hypothetical protein
MITYRNFIKEILPLTEEARSLRDAKLLHEDQAFRKWRNSIKQLLQQIVQQDYLISCQIARRSFGNYDSTYDQLKKSYQREIDDTINELEFIIDSYKKHGEPAKGGPSKETTQLEWPNKITLAWLFKHAPWALWTGFVALLVAAFVLGTQVAGTKLYGNLIDTLQPAQATQNTPRTHFEK